MNQTHYKCFSLGYRCTTSGLLKSLGLKNESHPFDWNISRLNVIQECLYDGFRDFMDLDNYGHRHTKTYDMLNSMEHIVCNEYITYNKVYQPNFQTDHTYEARLGFNHKNLLIKEDYEYYQRCIERFEHFLREDEESKMGVYMSPMITSEQEVMLELNQIYEFENFILNYGNKSVKKNIYFIVYKDKSRPRSKLELYQTLENGSQIFKIHVRPFILDAGEFFIENTVEPHTFEECESIKKVIMRSIEIKPYPTTTFVSCLADIYKTTVRFTPEQRIEQFAYLANCGVFLYIYACDNTRIAVEDFITHNGYNNIKMIHMYASHRNFPLYKECTQKAHLISLPDSRNVEKDTVDYMALMFAKLDFINLALESNPFHTENFAWVDFSMFHMVPNDTEKEYVCKYVKQISHIPYVLNSVVIPGCWSKMENTNSLLDQINWRFCGSFFLGNKFALKEFYDLHIRHLPQFLEKFKKVIWEVNFWAYLEYEHGWKPAWYSSDHNRRILEIPSIYLVKSLHNDCKTVDYVFDPIEGFFPSSCSFIHYNDTNIMNTRFVNYKLTPEGYYIIYHHLKHLQTINMCCMMNEHDLSEIEKYSEIILQKGHLECQGGSIHGLEDIRLFISKDNTLKFIATNVNYSHTKTNSMIIGDYNHGSGTMTNARVIKSPNGQIRCEKNWIPLPFSEKDQTQYYVYSWNPMKIGKINEANDELEIVYEYENDHPLLNRARGSTIFQEIETGLLGVVHFSDEGAPRRYYHLLVLLDKETYRPIKYSHCFYFHQFSIEFCTGFYIQNGDFHFFISNFDKDPQLVVVNSHKFDIWYNIL
tara:strand:+ start:2806 stop:5253 length:2448 start_codon:yes stop_codon:yes gene_type:complete